jgi:hypothetical protein
MSISMKLEGKADLSNRLKKAIQAMAKDYNQELKKHTPVRTGKAQRGWSLRRTQQGAKIKNSVKYIDYLEKGSSRQAPNGMTKPAKKQIQDNIRAGKYKMKRRK